MSTIQWIAGIVLILACTGMVMAYMWMGKVEQQQEAGNSEAVEAVLKDLQSRVNKLELEVAMQDSIIADLEIKISHYNGVLANWEGTWKALFEPAQKECEK